MKKLLIDIDCSIKDKELINKRWPWTYAHGEFEAEYGFDICVFNQDMPKEPGYYIAYTEEDVAVIIHLSEGFFGKLQGRCCYIDDYEALKYINSPELWT